GAARGLGAGLGQVRVPQCEVGVLAGYLLVVAFQQFSLVERTGVVLTWAQDLGHLASGGTNLVQGRSGSRCGLVGPVFLGTLHVQHRPKGEECHYQCSDEQGQGFSEALGLLLATPSGTATSSSAGGLCGRRVVGLSALPPVPGTGLRGFRRGHPFGPFLGCPARASKARAGPGSLRTGAEDPKRPGGSICPRSYRGFRCARTLFLVLLGASTVAND